MVKGIVYFIIATVGLLFAAVQPWIMAIYAVLMILAFGVLIWQEGLSWRPGPWVWATVGVFLAVTLLQMIPLPAGWLSALSPFRENLLAETAGILGTKMESNALAYSVYQAFARWGFVICLALFFWVCVSLGKDRKTFKRMVWVFLGLGVFEALYGLVQVLIPDVGVWWVPSDFAYYGCARGTYINRNNFAGLMEMMWPVVLGVTLAQGEWEEGKGVKALMAEEHAGNQLVTFVLAVLMLVALLFSRSRGGILGSFVGMIVLFVLLRAISGRFRWGFGIALALLILVVGIYGGQIGFERILERFFRIEAGGEGRMELWAQSWGMVKDHPLGIGLGNFQIIEPVYVNVREGFRNYYAHNDYLQLLIETGWAGALALVFGLFFFIVRAVRRIRKVKFDVGRFRILVSVGALAGICSLAFHGFFDFNFQIPANQVYFVLLLGLVESGLWPREKG